MQAWKLGPALAPGNTVVMKVHTLSVALMTGGYGQPECTSQFLMTTGEDFLCQHAMHVPRGTCAPAFAVPEGSPHWLTCASMCCCVPGRRKICYLACWTCYVLRNLELNIVNGVPPSRWPHLLIVCPATVARHGGCSGADMCWGVPACGRWQSRRHLVLCEWASWRLRLDSHPVSSISSLVTVLSPVQPWPATRASTRCV